MLESHAVCKFGDLRPGEGRAFEVGNKLVALFFVDGGYFAIDDVCPHMGASLSEGCVKNGIVTCPWHAWRFRLHDGAWADNPRIKTGCYPVEVVGDEIRIQIETTFRT
jgi:nitrite reductase (NADH) small subunit/3-phenylpropionate/trans-cinnamate dioxygenase ferredoxin subunit